MVGMRVFSIVVGGLTLGVILKLYVFKHVWRDAEHKDGSKSSVKNTKASSPKGKAPSRYHRYMTVKMAELKETEPELSTIKKFAKIAEMWKDDKATWIDPDSETSDT
jgi:hypothetical protein